MTATLSRRPLLRQLRAGLAGVLLLGAGLTAATPVALASEAATGGPPPVVRIRPLMLPVLTPAGQVERYTQLEVTLEVGNSMKLADVQTATPKLHDAILAEMYRGIEEGYIIRGAIANAPAVRRMLMEATGKVVGKDIITRVLITPTTRQSQWP